MHSLVWAHDAVLLLDRRYPHGYKTHGEYRNDVPAPHWRGIVVFYGGPVYGRIASANDWLTRWHTRMNQKELGLLTWKIRNGEPQSPAVVPAQQRSQLHSKQRRSRPMPASNVLARNLFGFF
jgi:hypothetical protein